MTESESILEIVARVGLEVAVLALLGFAYYFWAKRRILRQEKVIESDQLNQEQVD